MKIKIAFYITALTLVSFLWTDVAAAQAGTGSLELYGGIYSPEGADEEFTYGLRAGQRFSDHFGIDGTLGRFEIEGFDVLLADLSFKGYVNPGSKTEFFLYGGPGWGFADSDWGDFDSLTVHVGAGMDIQLSESVYLRPDIRGRWWEEGEGNDIDLEGSLAIGFRFGG